MNEQNQSNKPLDAREIRRERRAERRAERSASGGWIMGVVLIALGGLFLMQNMGASRIPISNWWALFILIPALGAFERGIRYYREANNQLTSQASGSLLVGILLSLITAAFLFNIGWTYFGPVLIILVGLGILFNGGRNSGSGNKPS